MWPVRNGQENSNSPKETNFQIEHSKHRDTFLNSLCPCCLRQDVQNMLLPRTESSYVKGQDL